MRELELELKMMELALAMVFVGGIVGLVLLVKDSIKEPDDE